MHVADPGCCFTEQQFDSILSSADPSALVVVDFYRTACGSCKYISAGFLKLCKGSHEGHAPVEFLKHNVFDEYVLIPQGKKPTPA